MILIVDDDPSVLASVGLLLKQHGRVSVAAGSPEKALELLATRPVELVLQDMNFSRDTSGREGLELLREIRRRHADLPVILVTAWGTIPLAVEGIKAGASDFVTKPWTNQHLLRSVETLLELRVARPGDGAAVIASRSELDRRLDLGGLVGEDPAFCGVLELAGRVAPTDASVLIAGESGTGKELLAEAIHRNSPRSGGPFVKVNLGGISSTLFESEMFGHVRGAFTDARGDREGRFQLAGGGTILLDEIGELDPSSQVKLLRVLQDRTYEMLGSSRTRTVDVRVVSATNRDLEAAVRDGGFREDLLYRLNLITLRIPPLRERPGDVPLLARHFLAEATRRYGRPPVALDDGALAWLRRQPWPGNVRELEQSIARAVLVGSQGGRLTAAALEQLARLQRPEGGTELPTPGSMTLDELERAMIDACMRHYDGNVTRAAEALGLSRAALYRRLDKHGRPRDG